MRVLERLDRLYAIGGGPGANRLGGTPRGGRGARARRRLDARGRARGRGRRGREPLRAAARRRPELPEVWTGSHLDSVPNGGRFDGALGVVGGARGGRAARAARADAGRGRVPGRGGLQRPGCRGSRRCAGGSTGAGGLRRAAHRAGAAARAGRRAARRRDRRSRPRREARSSSRAARARGTTPMAAARRRARRRGGARAPAPRRGRDVDGAVATVGRLEVEPGASNVIPARVVLSVDVRAPDDERLEQVAAVVPGRALARTRAAAMSTDAAGGAARASWRLAACPRSSSPRARATTPACSRRRACRRRCSSSAA